MSVNVDNAIILAAGTASRFAPISYEKHKALITVKGEILIERQIRQLLEAGIKEIVIVTGYKSEDFEYLKEKYKEVILIKNEEYLTKNNNSSIKAAEKYLKNSYICSSDNYFPINPFKKKLECSFYSALFSKGKTKEWCITTDENDFIVDVKIGGENSWFMLGHVFWDKEFSHKFLKILNSIYNDKETRDKLWETIYIDNIKELPMKIQKYNHDEIIEFDTLDELRKFDDTYINNSNSKILFYLSSLLKCEEKEMEDFKTLKSNSNEAIGFIFKLRNKQYKYKYKDKKLEVL